MVVIHKSTERRTCKRGISSEGYLAVYTYSIYVHQLCISLLESIIRLDRLRRFCSPTVVWVGEVIWEFPFISDGFRLAQMYQLYAAHIHLWEE